MYRIGSEDFNIAKIADSGQCFRLTKNENGFGLIAHNRRLNIVVDGRDCLLDCPEEDVLGIWRDYFDLDTDYSAFRSAVPAEDSYMQSAIEYGRGIRILRQDAWEMLISFIISQRKSIPAIRTSVEALCRSFGEQLDSSSYAFPSAQALAKADFDSLSACSLGYRTEYVQSTARAVAEGVFDLEALKNVSDDELIEQLITLRGVGVKVAHCVLLFGYHRLDAFPRDVWINRVIDNEYAGSFSIEPYKGFAGVIQQYMFFYGRNKR